MSSKLLLLVLPLVLLLLLLLLAFQLGASALHPKPVEDPAHRPTRRSRWSLS